MKNTFEIIITTVFGLEALCAKEIRNLGYDTTEVADGRVTFLGDMEAVVRANLNIRTGERILIKVGEFSAMSFDELFDKTKELDWASWLPKNAKFPVKGFTFKSGVYSVSDCQSIIKKSIATSLSQSYHIDWLPEDGPLYQIEFSNIRDRFTLMIDTSGDGLHKRGYRRKHNAAPLKETIAAAIIMLSRFSYNGILADPFCGSGTFACEAGLIAKNIAPGINRHFAFENFVQLEKGMLSYAKEEAKDLERPDTKLRILASDIDPECTKIAYHNCNKAGVGDIVTVKTFDAAKFRNTESMGTMICNPPYGERMLTEKECEKILSNTCEMYKRLDNWALMLLTPDENFEKIMGRKADKRRKIYNGMIRCNLYQYFSKKH